MGPAAKPDSEQTKSGLSPTPLFRHIPGALTGEDLRQNGFVCFRYYIPKAEVLQSPGEMMPTLVLSDWYVTEEKVVEAVRRLVEAVDPLEIIAFGSRARGTHRPDSDLDLAVILDVPEADALRALPSGIFKGLGMSVDLLPVAKERYDRFRPWINTVHRQIDREGVRLYERGGKSASSDVIRKICRG
jgi:predicted nucleotidyltransferase